MMYGITYRGRHSREFGLVVKTRTRPAAPPVRVVEETIPYRDGSLDYSGQAGRLFYDDKILELDFTAPGRELSETNRLVAAVVSWLAGGWDELVFDDMPQVKWIAKPIELSDITLSLYRVGTFTVQFRCRPFNRLMWGSLGLPLDSGVPLDSDISLDFGAENVHDMPNTGSYTFSHTNVGDVAARPKLVITGDTDTGAHTIAIRIGEAALTLATTSARRLSGGRSLTVDCQECAVFWDDGSDATGLLASDPVSGIFPEFPEIPPGACEIAVTTAITGRLQVDYEDLYYFGFVEG